MKKAILLTAILTLFCTGISAQQKMYIYPPKKADYTRITTLDNISINLTIKDARIITPKSEVKATFEQISDAIEDALKLTYGDNFINPQSDINIIIEVTDYSVVFNAPIWNAHVNYTFRYEDVTNEIAQTNSTNNTLGKASGKNILNKCFYGANIELFHLLNKLLRDVNDSMK